MPEVGGVTRPEWAASLAAVGAGIVPEVGWGSGDQSTTRTGLPPEGRRATAQADLRRALGLVRGCGLSP